MSSLSLVRCNPRLSLRDRALVLVMMVFRAVSWDEMGKYDIPAVVDYVLEATGQEQLSYVCHSLGCGSLFIGAVERPPLNGLVDVAVALAPSVSWANLNEAFLDIEPLLEELRDATRALGISAYLSDDRRSRETASTLCRRQFGARAPQCCSVPFQFLEALNTNLDQSLVPLIQRLYPAGVSYRTVQQFYQNFRAGQTFQVNPRQPVITNSSYHSHQAALVL